MMVYISVMGYILWVNGYINILRVNGYINGVNRVNVYIYIYIPYIHTRANDHLTEKVLGEFHYELFDYSKYS